MIYVKVATSRCPRFISVRLKGWCVCITVLNMVWKNKIKLNGILIIIKVKWRIILTLVKFIEISVFVEKYKTNSHFVIFTSILQGQDIDIKLDNRFIIVYVLYIDRRKYYSKFISIYLLILTMNRVS